MLELVELTRRYGDVVALDGLTVSVPAGEMSFLPPTAPIVMPARVAAGGAEPWEVLLAVALVVLGVVLVARLAAHIYPRVALHSGARLKLREAWRAQAA